ncbi:UNC93-like protein [Orchesella cincta]|uniref:UNC93-like protein n=1 Tax=Orchesella cincta TaxID=48709 RepID=A0A1D2NHW4_ORCCI|nr:UNC93-like protein [Orchesella cincta]
MTVSNNAVSGNDLNLSSSTVASNRKLTIQSVSLAQLEKYSPNEPRRMQKNVYVASIGFLLLFTAFNSISNLQSSIHPENGLGTIGSSSIYAALILSSLLVPTYAIRKLTTKWTLVLSMVGYMFYMGAQFHPTFGTIIPTAILVGLCGAPLWASKSFYLTHVGNKYAEFVQDDAEVIIVRFFGIFFCLFQNSQIWGNLLSSLILSSGSSNWKPNETQIEKCGASFCPGDLYEIEDEEKSADLQRKINIFCGVCLALAFIAIGFTSIFLDSLDRYGEKERLEDDAVKMSTKRSLISTLRHMKKPYQLLLIPLTIFSGLEQSFFSADFTQKNTNFIIT